MGRITVEHITKLVNEHIEDTDLFIGEIKVKPGNVIYVFLDGDNGVTIEKCVEVSRYIEKNLDRTNEDFELNVSSYGIGQPLKYLRQYRNAIGKQLSVILNDGTKHVGKLLQVEESSIVIQKVATKKKDSPIELTIELKDIKIAKLDVVFK